MSKSVLITGGARRVGAALALHFAQHGWSVALHYNRSQAQAETLREALSALGVACKLFRHDLADTKGIPSLMRRVQEEMPHVCALVNNASIFERAPFMDTDEALFDRQFAVNFKAPFFLTQAYAKTFGKGAVVNILDTDIVQTQPSHFAYLLSKKVLAEFTRMAARELGANIRVNGVCPGILLPSNELDVPYMKKLETELPLKLLATPDQVAEAARFLCENNAVTGQLLFVDGGQQLL